MGNPATRWATALVDELVASGCDVACIAPGSRSTPLTLAFVDHPDVRTYSLLDERSAAFAALGRGRVTGRPTPVVTTSGTAVANLHPAVIEADQARVPLLLLTADRPPELRDSGANQTIDQVDIFGGAVRWARDLPAPTTVPDPGDRIVRSLRTTAARAVRTATGPPAGPVHLNLPFRKPLEPGTDARPGVDDVAEETGSGDAVDAHPAGNATPGPTRPTDSGRPAVRTATGTPRLAPPDLERVAEALATADRPLVVAGPADLGTDLAPVDDLAAAIGAPMLADPLSGLRFGAGEATVCGGYDAYLQPAVTDDWPDPDCVFRVGASPTSKRLRTYLRDADARQFLVDPAGGWREATFTATDLVAADPGQLASAVATRARDGEIGAPADSSWATRFDRAEREYWDLVAERGRPAEAAVVDAVVRGSPDGTAVVVGNSTPIRDGDRFVAPDSTELTLIGNRGASGIDGTISTAVGAATATAGPTACVLGDLSTYHDATGLLSAIRAEVAPTFVVIDNDGGGIFHALPIAAHDPPFTERFRTPHGTDFGALASAFGLRHRTATVADLPDTFDRAIRSDDPELVVVETDAAQHHRDREALQDAVADRLG